MSFNNSKNISYLVHNQHHKWLCILLTISILICSASPVFALGPNSTLNQVLSAFEAGKNVGEMFAMLMGWNQTGTSVEEAILISIAAELQYIFDNSYGYDIVNPYSGISPSYHVTGKSFGQMLADLNNSLATFGYRFMYNTSTGNSYLYDLYLLTGRMELILGGANGNNITAISSQLSTIGQMLQGNTQNGYIADNIVPTLNSISSQTQSLQNDLNNIAWNTLSHNFKGYSLDRNTYNTSQGTITQNQQLFIGYSFSMINVQNGIYHVRIPANFYRTDLITGFNFLSGQFINQTLSNYVVLYGKDYTDLYFEIAYSQDFANFDLEILHNGTILYRPSNQTSIFEYLPNDSNDYYTVYNWMLNYNNNNKQSDIITAINNLENKDINVQINDSVNVTPVELDISIGISDFDTTNRAVNKLRDWLTTGVGILPLIAALDSLDDSFFIQENQNIIETINYQYIDFYD